MKLIQDLPEVFEKFGEQRRQAFLEIKEYKDKGIPVVGMYCAYFPTELAIAVGAIPVGLCSFANETIASAEKEMPRSMCPLVKSSYGFAVEDKCPFFHFSDLVVGETTCDGKKKMYELMAEFKPVFVMELPNSQSDKGMEFWKQEILRTKEYFEEFFHVIITEEMLREAVHLNNRIRASLKNLCSVMKLNPAPVLGENIQKMITGSKYRFDFHSTPEVVDAVASRILEEYRQGKMLEKRPRILVTGCPMGGDSMKVVREIEKNGGVVVAMENCSGVKSFDRMVDEDQEDIYEAIARRYLSTGCSIMTPNDNRVELIGNIIDEYQVEGVVEMILRGCHATGAESIFIRKFVNEEKNIPYIAIDTDYSSADTAQISTRMAAFLEMIQEEKGEEDDININYCYKIALSGITKGESIKQVLEEISEYTGVKLLLYGREVDREVSTGAGESVVERMLPDGQGKIAAIVPRGKRKSKIDELLDILVKEYGLKEQSVRPNRLNPQSGCPDFLWILSVDGQMPEGLYEELLENAGFLPKIRRHRDKSILVSGMKGKEEREQLVRLCMEYMEQTDGSVLIGNGFHNECQKEENKRMQYKVLEFVKKSRLPKKVYLTENYYYELAASYIGEKIEKENCCLEELECIKREDKEKGRNLYETLYWYLRMKRNVMQTAVSLKIHRNTLLPRIARINELIGLDEKNGIECEKLLLVMEVQGR